MAQPQQPQHSLTGAETSAPAGTFPPFESDTFTSQLLWFALTFGLLYWLMSKVALPKIAATLHDRSTRLASDLNEAQKLRTEAEAAGEAYEQSLASARAKATAIAQEARNATNAESDAQRKRLEAELAGRIASAEETIRGRTDEAMASVRGIAADTATAIVERLLGQAPDRATVESALDRTISR